MKKVLILALFVAATGLSACHDDPPPPRHVYHHTTVYRDRGPSVGSPSNESAEGFQAVSKPDTYSGR